MSPPPTRRRGRPAVLSKEELVARALLIVNEAGVDALTMRALAQSFDVSPMAIYRHFADKDHLLAAVLDKQIADGRRPRLTGDSRERLSRVFEWMLTGMTGRPWVIDLIIGGNLDLPAVGWSTDAILQSLVDLGLSERDAKATLEAAWRYTVGSAVLERTSLTPAVAMDTATGLGGAPSSSVVRHAGQVDAFRSGLNHLIDGALSAAKSSPKDSDSAGPNGRVGYWTLRVDDIDRAADFFSRLFGWEFGPPDANGGRLIRGQFGGIQPRDKVWSPIVFLYSDAELASARTRALGGSVRTPLVDEGAGAYFEALDPGGVRFAVWAPRPGYAPPPFSPSNAGLLGSYSLFSNDIDTSRLFFASLFGWTYGTASTTWSVPIKRARPVGFISPAGRGAHGGITLIVEDLPKTVSSIRDLSGWAEEPIESPYGLYTHASDDQGTLFSLWQRAN